MDAPSSQDLAPSAAADSHRKRHQDFVLCNIEGT
jgi:hypothetical protein